MEPLAQMTCVACQPGEPTVSEEESREYLKQIPEWRIVEQGGIPHLMRVFTSPTSPAHWTSPTASARWPSRKAIIRRC